MVINLLFWGILYQFGLFLKWSEIDMLRISPDFESEVLLRRSMIHMIRTLFKIRTSGSKLY